jgi:hypothetical protein
VSSEYSIADDAGDQGALPVEATSGDEGVRSDEPETVGGMTVDALMERITQDPRLYNTVKSHAQREADRKFSDAMTKLEAVTTEQGHIRTILASHDDVVNQYAPVWERWLDEQDPDTRARLKEQYEVRSTKQLAAAMAAEQARQNQPAQNQDAARWQQTLRSEWEADDGFGDELRTYAESKGLSYDRVYASMTDKGLWPKPRSGQSAANFAQSMVREAKKHADVLSADTKKRETAPVKAGAETRGGGTGTVRTWEQAQKLTSAKDMSDEEYFALIK